MNNDLEQFSEERLEEIIDFAIAGAIEVVELARIALSVKQAKPVAWKLTHVAGAVSTEFNKEVAALFGIFNGNIVEPLYTTPQPAHTEQDGWIKCSERMPPSSDPVWAYAQPSFEYAVEAYWDGDWYRTLTDEPEHSITHWMPLPAAPKPESE